MNAPEGGGPENQITPINIIKRLGILSNENTFNTEASMEIALTCSQKSDRTRRL